MRMRVVERTFAVVAALTVATSGAALAASAGAQPATTGAPVIVR